MGLFSRNRRASTSPQQIPDQLAAQALDKYGNQDFAGALETYRGAIDKIHTMCVVADRDSRIRQLDVSDEPILDGFVSSLGAALAVDPDRNIQSIVQSTVAYLAEISVEAEKLGGPAAMYRDAIERIELAYRLGSS